MSEQGYRLYGEHGMFLPVPQAFKAREMRLIRYISGLSFREWALAVNTFEGFADPLNQAATIAASWWQQNPEATEQQAREFGDKLDLDKDVEFVGFEDDPEDDAGPPDVEAAAS